MANDADVQDIKDEVKEIGKGINKISNSNSKIFNRLSTIVNIETSLGSVSENTKHIKENFDSSGNFYGLIEKIRGEVSGVKQALNQSSNQHINSTGSTSSTITNISNSNEAFGGFSDVIGKIYDELRDFHRDIVSVLGDINGINTNASYDEILKYLQNVHNANEKIKKDDEAKQHNLKTDKEYWKKKKREEREEERARKAAERTSGEGFAKGISSAFKGLSSIAEGVSSGQTINALTSGLSQLGPWGAVAGGAISAIKSLFDMYAKQDKEASDYARSIGGSRYQKGQIFLRANDIAGSMPWRYNINQEDIIKQTKETAEALGRNISHLSNQSLLTNVMLSKMGINAEAINNFDTYGKSIQDTDKYITELYQGVSKRGLSFKNVSKAVNENLKAAQSYNFANGLKGLQTMAERSTQLKFNMQQAMTFANNVSDFEGAIKTAASLSVLGGSFSNFANPMQMMYEGLNDVEALQERMIKMFGGHAFYNQAKGQMDINPVMKNIMQEAAKGMGVDPGEMLSLALNEGRYRMIEGQINKSIFDKDTIEFIKNLSELRNGNAYITLNGKEKAVRDLSSEDAKQIQKEAELAENKKNATIGDIYVNTMGVGETLDALFKYITTKLGTWVAKIAGVGFSDKADKAAWHMMGDEQKEALIKKYGSKKSAKAAVGLGLETEEMDKVLSRGNILDSDAARQFINERDHTARNAAEFIFGAHWSRPITNNIFRYRFQNGAFDNDINGITAKRGNGQRGRVLFGPSHREGGILAVQNGQLVELEGTETIVPANITKNLGGRAIEQLVNGGIPRISNINGNTLDPISVTPTSSVGAQKIEISPGNMTLNIQGRIMLDNNGKSIPFDLSKMPQTDIDKLTSLIYKQIYAEISTKINRGFDKENYPFRGA